MYFGENRTLFFFWLAGAFMGIFVGPVQAASRSYMARAAPEVMRRQMFGLYAFSGKATAFVGPLLVGWLTYFSGSQRIGHKHDSGFAGYRRPADAQGAPCGGLKIES